MPKKPPSHKQSKLSEATDTSSFYRPSSKTKPGQKTKHRSKQQIDELPGAFALFEPSFRALKLNFVPFALGAIIPVLILVLPLLFSLSGVYSLPSKPGNSTTDIYNVAIILAGIIGVGAGAVFFLPYMYILKLQSAKGIKTTFGATLKQSLQYFWRVLGLYVCRTLVISAGLILLIVPGLFMWRRYMLAPFYLIDDDVGIFDAMRLSAADSRPAAPAIWGMIGVYVLITVFGIFRLTGIIALLASIIYCCAQALRYTQVAGVKS